MKGQQAIVAVMEDEKADKTIGADLNTLNLCSCRITDGMDLCIVTIFTAHPITPVGMHRTTAVVALSSAETCSKMGISFLDSDAKDQASWWALHKNDLVCSILCKLN